MYFKSIMNWQEGLLLFLRLFIYSFMGPIWHKVIVEEKIT